MKRVICAGLLSMVFFTSCKKKESVTVAQAVSPAATALREAICGKSTVADKQVKAGETGIVLPRGTRLCVSDDELQVRVELPKGFSFVLRDTTASGKTLPVIFTGSATYACYCSQQSACNVFYLEGNGFGCLQSSCTGSCTGKFTYKGYTVDRVAVTMSMDEFFGLPEVTEFVSAFLSKKTYEELSLYGVKFFVVNDVRAFESKASCDCEGTQACKLKTITIPDPKAKRLPTTIYFCEGSCNGCELTVS